jgi:uncharacterized membrane-anchored protein YhcB (DUF1043 family)
MSTTQYWTLNFVGGVCALLLLVNLVLGRLNERSSRSLVATQNQLVATQNQIDHARQTQATMQSLVVRTAQSAQSEPALIELLNRHNLKVNLNVDGQMRQVP